MKAVRLSNNKIRLLISKKECERLGIKVAQTDPALQPVEAPVPAPTTAPTPAPVTAPSSEPVAKGVQSVIRRNADGRLFLTLFGNTFPVKDLIKNLGFRFFKGTWSKAVDQITPENRAELERIGIDCSPMDESYSDTPANAEPASPETPYSDTEIELMNMRKGVDDAMKESNGDSKVSNLLSFVENMIDRVAKMTDEAAKSEFIKDFMAFAAKFHNYSFGNQMLIWVQNPRATYVAGFKNWIEKGREVVNWDKGIAIIVPMTKKVEITPEQLENIPPDQREKYTRRMFFGAGKVYDIADTKPIEGWKSKEGFKPFEPPQWRQDSNDQLEEISAMVEAAKGYAVAQGIDVGSEEMSGDKGGYSAGGKIRLNSTFEGINLFSTMVHELAHELIHWAKDEAGARTLNPEIDSKKDREIDAETTAYIVLQHYGFETKDTPNYLALWQASGEDVKKRREAISKTVKTIINGIDGNMRDQKVEDDIAIANTRHNMRLAARTMWGYMKQGLIRI